MYITILYVLHVENRERMMLVEKVITMKDPRLCVVFYSFSYDTLNALSK